MTFYLARFERANLLCESSDFFSSKKGKTASLDINEEKHKLHAVSVIGESPCFLRVVEKIPL